MGFLGLVVVVAVLVAAAAAVVVVAVVAVSSGSWCYVEAGAAAVKARPASRPITPETKRHAWEAQSLFP